MGEWTGESLFRMCGRPFFARPLPSMLDGHDGRPIMGPQSAPNNGRFVAAHFAFRWPSQNRRPTLPTFCVHLAQLSTSNPVQCGRPNKPTVAANSSPRWSPTFVQCGRPDKSTMAAHIPPRQTANPVHVGRPVRPKWSATSHLHPRLGGRPKSATPLAVHTSRDINAQFRPPFGSPLWSPTQRTTQASSPDYHSS